mmetsp:Transcript_8985/g.16197  ORF Transcript_8985/g.16197 Transcript_8985/m.16197 type:complete len:267 (+) Transcript_8985:351-1151(+)
MTKQEVTMTTMRTTRAFRGETTPILGAREVIKGITDSSALRTWHPSNERVTTNMHWTPTKCGSHLRLLPSPTTNSTQSGAPPTQASGVSNPVIEAVTMEKTTITKIRFCWEISTVLVAAVAMAAACSCTTRRMRLAVGVRSNGAFRTMVWSQILMMSRVWIDCKTYHIVRKVSVQIMGMEAKATVVSRCKMMMMIMIMFLSMAVMTIITTMTMAVITEAVGEIGMNRNVPTLRNNSRNGTPFVMQMPSLHILKWVMMSRTRGKNPR